MILDQSNRVLRAIAEEGIQLNVMMWGPNGTGKTSGFKQLSKHLGWDFWIQQVASMDRTEISGLPFKSEYTRKDGTTVLVQKMAYPEYVIKAMEGNIVILFDEVNKGPNECRAALLEFINERSINGKPLSSNILIGMTGNPPDDRNQVKTTDSAFNDRVVHILITTDPTSTLNYFEDEAKDKHCENPIHPDILAYLRSNPKKLIKLDERDFEIPVERKVSPRNWKERANRIWANLNPVKDKYGITQETIFELITGTLGDDAIEFINYIKSAEKPISLKDVIGMDKAFLEKIKIMSNIDDQGNEILSGKTQMGYFQPVCSEIERPENQEIVEANYEKILEFLTEIPSSFSFRVISKFVKTSKEFWSEKLQENVINPETKEFVKNPINGNHVKRWDKLISIHKRQSEIEKKRQSDFIDSKINNGNNGGKTSI